KGRKHSQTKCAAPAGRAAVLAVRRSNSPSFHAPTPHGHRRGICVDSCRRGGLDCPAEDLSGARRRFDMRMDRFTTLAQEALASAQSMAVSKSHAEMSPLHILAALLEDK